MEIVNMTIYLRDNINGTVEVGDCDVDVRFEVNDEYEVSFECPICYGYGYVSAQEIRNYDREHNIECPYCGGCGRAETSVYIEIDEETTVEGETDSVGAYGDGNLNYYSNRVQDEMDNSTLKRVIEGMEARRKAEKLKGLSVEEIAEVERVQKIETEIAVMIEALQQAKARVEEILRDEVEVKETVKVLVQKQEAPRLYDVIVYKCEGSYRHGTTARVIEIDGSDIPYHLEFEDNYQTWATAYKIGEYITAGCAGSLQTT